MSQAHDLYEELVQAAQNGDIAGMARAVEAVPDFGWRSGRDTPLAKALVYGHDAAARWLLERGADINTAGPNGRSALFYASGTLLFELLRRPDVHVDDPLAVDVLRSNAGDLDVRAALELRGADLSAWEDTLRQLFFRLESFQGPLLFERLLEPAARTFGPLVGRMDHLRTRGRAATDVEREMYELYALSRIHDVLVCGIAPRTQGSRYYWDRWPLASARDHEAFFRGLGFETVRPAAFHPIFHEIVRVTEAADADEPPRILDTLWSAVMLGQLVFARAGVHVTAGRHHLVAPLAERSPLYWSYARPNREADDLSHGWGSGSQWATFARRDYVDDQGYHYNVDGEVDLNDPTAYEAHERRWGFCGPPLPRAYMIELVTHRCHVTRALPDDDEDSPYDYYLSVPR